MGKAKIKGWYRGPDLGAWCWGQSWVKNQQMHLLLTCCSNWANQSGSRLFLTQKLICVITDLDYLVMVDICATEWWSLRQVAMLILYTGTTDVLWSSWEPWTSERSGWACPWILQLVYLHRSFAVIQVHCLCWVLCVDLSSWSMLWHMHEALGLSQHFCYSLWGSNLVQNCLSVLAVSFGRSYSDFSYDCQS